MKMSELSVLFDLKELIQQGTDNFYLWAKQNPEKTSEILKAHYQLFLTEIMQGEIFEFEE